MKKTFALIICVVVMLFALAGCSSRTWEGTWQRTGDSTFSRAEIVISEATSKGITFSLRVYNGNLAGRLDNVFAEFYNDDNTAARYYVPGSDCYIDLSIEDDTLNVYFNSDSYANYVDEENEGVAIIMTEETVLGFSSGGYIAGEYTRDGVEYLNDSLVTMGVCEEKYDSQLADMMTEEMYIRMMDCFQQYRTERHDDIGGYITYGSNSLQEYAAALICYDDGSVSVVITTEIGGIVYYTNNHIYTSAMLPYPLSDWIALYQGEDE